MRFIAYDSETHEILSLAPSPMYAVRAARQIAPADALIESTVCADDLAHALTAAGAPKDWFLDGRGIARLMPETVEAD